MYRVKHRYDAHFKRDNVQLFDIFATLFKPMPTITNELHIFYAIYSIRYARSMVKLRLAFATTRMLTRVNHAQCFCL